MGLLVRMNIFFLFSSLIPLAAIGGEEDYKRGEYVYYEGEGKSDEFIYGRVTSVEPDLIEVRPGDYMSLGRKTSFTRDEAREKVLRLRRQLAIQGSCGFSVRKGSKVYFSKTERGRPITATVIDVYGEAMMRVQVAGSNEPTPVHTSSATFFQKAPTVGLSADGQEVACLWDDSDSQFCEGDKFNFSDVDSTEGSFIGFSIQIKNLLVNSTCQRIVEAEATAMNLQTGVFGGFSSLGGSLLSTGLLNYRYRNIEFDEYVESIVDLMSDEQGWPKRSCERGPIFSDSTDVNLRDAVDFCNH